MGNALPTYSETGHGYAVEKAAGREPPRSLPHTNEGIIREFLCTTTGANPK
ncbi:MAG: hypothetical protein L0338_08535 [Acidobacteria bacterium]|nr:hypothetical protein [Acidobacteriota bacterium]